MKTYGAALLYCTNTFILTTAFPNITAYWKESERDERAEDIQAVRSEIAQTPNARVLALSCSATMAIYSTEQCLDRLQMWSQWHEHWLYGTVPTVELPSAMPVRSLLGPVQPLGGTVGTNGLVGPPNLTTIVDLFEMQEPQLEKGDDESLTDHLDEPVEEPSEDDGPLSETASLSSLTESFPSE